MRSKYQIKILELLNDSKKSLTTREIQFNLGISYAMVTRHLRILTNKKAVTRVGSMNGYHYKFRKWPHETKEFDSVTPSQAHEFLTKLTEPEWRPRVSTREEWGKLPNVLIGLNILYVKLSQGERINQKDLDSFKAELRSLMTVIDTFRNGVGSLLATDELWDSHTLAAFLGGNQL